MNSIVMLPLAGVPVAATSTDPDAELVALADRLKSLHPSIVKALARVDDAERRYDAIKPERPAALIWRAGDLGFVSRDVSTPFVAEESVDALRDRKFVRWDFIGTEKDLEEKLGLGVEYFGTSILPVRGHEHLFISRPDEHRQGRASELIAALDEDRTANEAAMEQSGLIALQEALDVLFDERREIVDRMLELRPKTLRGLQALGAGVVYAYRSGKIDSLPSQTIEDEMLATVIRTLFEGNIAAA